MSPQGLPAPARKVPQCALGFMMLSGTLLLWVASSVVVQAIFGGEVRFRKPMFVTLFNAAVSVSLLTPQMANCRLGTATSLSVVKLSATVGLLWLCSQWIFNLSLLYTSVATNAVLSSTSSVFTFFFSLVICHDPFRRLSFVAAVLSCLGCTIVSLQQPKTLTHGAVQNSTLGDALALTSAAMFALTSVLFRKLAPADLDAALYMGINGLLALVISPLLLYLGHMGGFERFTAPTHYTLAALTANALLGCSLANYLYTSALLLLPPLVVNICMSLSIPISAVTDELLLGQHRFSVGWAFGAAITSIGVVFAALDPDSAASWSSEAAEDVRGEVADEAELESLIKSVGECDTNGGTWTSVENVTSMYQH